MKERDIEAKLKSIINDWTAQDFQFSAFKNRGELLFKGDVAIEAIALLEDSLMALGSLLSNRYNAPFKPRIQEWVRKLTTTNEVIENLFKVQNLWIYLEAVFVGGDIAKQLPQVRDTQHAAVVYQLINIDCFLPNQQLVRSWC